MKFDEDKKFIDLNEVQKLFDRIRRNIEATMCVDEEINRPQESLVLLNGSLNEWLSKIDFQDGKQGNY